MTKDEIFRTAMAQSAVDSNCSPCDFVCKENKVFVSAANSGARKYLELPHYCDFTSFQSALYKSSASVPR